MAAPKTVPNFARVTMTGAGTPVTLAALLGVDVTTQFRKVQIRPDTGNTGSIIVGGKTPMLPANSVSLYKGDFPLDIEPPYPRVIAAGEIYIDGSSAAQIVQVLAIPAGN